MAAAAASTTKCLSKFIEFHWAAFYTYFPARTAKAEMKNKMQQNKKMAKRDLFIAEEEVKSAAKSPRLCARAN